MGKIPLQKLDFVRASAELRKVNRLCDRKQAFVDAVGTFRGQLYPDLKCENQRSPWATRTKKSQTIQLEWMQNCDGYKAVSIISQQRSELAEGVELVLCPPERLMIKLIS